MTRPVTFLFQPVIIPLAEMVLDPQGLDDLVDWVGDYRPECLPGENPTGQVGPFRWEVLETDALGRMRVRVEHRKGR